MRYLLTLLLPVIFCVGCANNVAKVRARLVSIEGHARDIRAFVADYRSEQPPEATEPPQIEAIDKSAQEIMGDVKDAQKATEGTQDRPDMLGRLTKFVGYILAGVLLIVLIGAFLYFRRSLAGTALALFRSKPNEIPTDIPRHAQKVLQKHRPQ